jgi:hypothetical protein
MVDDVTWRLVRVALSLVISATLSLSLVPHANVRAAGAVAPMLLVTDSANTADPFGPYLGEILRAEGLPTFGTADVSTLSPTMLSTSGIVILGPTTGLSANQVTMLTNFVQGGGHLIAMRPPAALASPFGVTLAGGTTTEPFMKIVGSGLGAGFNTTPLQVHPVADNYTLSGATAVATLNSSFTAATPYAAVTTKSLGQGQAMLWAYDLAQSVVYTRQSNPAQVGEHDGATGYRTTDLFAGYVNLNDVPIPQADEQQRLLAKAIETMNAAPIPHLWYFPQNAGSVLVLTGDAHANPPSFFTNELSSIQKYGGHITFYLSHAPVPGASDVAAWEQAGNGVGIHPYADPSLPSSPGCGTTDGNQIGAGITYDSGWFQSQFGRSPSPTVRIQYFAWQCWSDVAALEASAGIQMDTDVYAWGSWLKKPDNSWAHGYINGSGLPMQMVDATGNLIPVYQQATALIDEQLIATVASNQENLTGAQAANVSKVLLDASLSGGNYAAVTAQFQVDYFAYNNVTTWAEQTMAYAQSKGVPIWSADDWLRFTKARAGTAFGTPTWDGQHMTFTMTVPSGPDAMPLMLPLISEGGRLTSLTVDGSSVPFQTRVVKGMQSAVASVPAGSHTVVATYVATTPIVSAVTPATGPTAGGTTVTISGAHIDPLATVTFDGMSATVTSVASDGTSLTTVSPAHAGGAVDVVVTNPGNRSASVHNAFTYLPPPIITAVSPPSGATIGGTRVTISGTGFQSGAAVTFGAASATNIVVSPDGTTMTLTVPPNSAGVVNIAVTNPDGQHGALLAAYTYGVVNPLPNPQQPGPPANGSAPAPLPRPGPTGVPSGGAKPAPLPASR